MNLSLILLVIAADQVANLWYYRKFKYDYEHGIAVEGSGMSPKTFAVVFGLVGAALGLCAVLLRADWQAVFLPMLPLALHVYDLVQHYRHFE